MITRDRLLQYAYLVRLHKPIGILLLLWPTLWALWIAGRGHPEFKNLMVFIAGVILMRSAGCAINDIFDRDFDKHVMRTKSRPLASGKISLKEALAIALILSGIAFCFVLFCNRLTIFYALGGALFVAIYPLLKRYTHLPQLGLGVAFSWGVPMAFAAERGQVQLCDWFFFLTCTLWPVIYDTMYAMVDRSEDIKIGVKSTAILFNFMDRVIIGLLQFLFLCMLVIVGLMYRLHPVYYGSLLIVGVLFLYQQWLLKDRVPALCFKAFLNNNWVGLAIFVGIFLNF